MSLTDFLLARIADDEDVAKTEWPNNVGPHLSRCTLNAPEHAVIGEPWCDCGYPARVLAECEAKRRIVVDMYAKSEVELGGYANAVDETLAILALPYADHPDYREEWKP